MGGKEAMDGSRPYITRGGAVQDVYKHNFRKGGVESREYQLILSNPFVIFGIRLVVDEVRMNSSKNHRRIRSLGCL